MYTIKTMVGVLKILIKICKRWTCCGRIDEVIGINRNDHSLRNC